MKQTAPDRERADALEDRYLQIVGTYRDKDTIRAYPELLAIAWQAIGAGCEFLGSVATQMEALNARLGQFFTPWEVSLMLAKMTLEDVADIIGRNGFVTIQEPASGAGGMVLAAAQALADQGFDPGLHMLVHATDLSPLCFHMTYLQLSLRGISAFVEHGNSLSLERFSAAWTPAALAFHRHHGRLFPEPESAEPDASGEDAGSVILLGGQLQLL